MSPDYMERIFEPFSRSESEVKEIQGTGLGMAITKSLTDAMGGNIRVDRQYPWKRQSFLR